MLTQCPECQTVFRLSLGQLEAADGRVRCGVCDSVFNALSAVGEQSEALEAIDEDGEEDSQPDPDAPPPGAKTLPSPYEPSPDSLEDTAEHEIIDVEIESTPLIEITMEGERIDIDGEELIEDTGEETLEDTGELVVVDAASDRAQDVDDNADDASDYVAVDLEAQSAPAPVEAAAEEADSASEALPASKFQQAAPPTHQAPPPALRQRSHEMVLPSGKRVIFGEEPAADDDALPAVLAPKQKPALSRRWIAGAAVAGALLISQLVHFNRDALTRSAVGPILMRVYAALGLELSPAWNLQAYEVRQWGATADPKAGGALRVRASLFNTGERAQPYPLLRLTLQDRFGSRIATRDLQPEEYLPGSPAGKLLQAGERVDAQIAVVDPGKDAVGFEMDVCLRAPHERIVCANDPQH